MNKKEPEHRCFGNKKAAAGFCNGFIAKTVDK